MSSPSGTPFLFIRCKPYITLDHLIEIIHSIVEDPEKGSLTQYFSVPFSYLEKITAEFSDYPNLIFGTDSLNAVTEQSFTQNVAVRMLKNAGARFALVGTSERRYLMRETDESISLKIRRCFDEQLEPILCFGETLQEYQKGKSEEVLKGQISNSLQSVEANEIQGLRLIYEAPWIDRLAQRPTGEQLKQSQILCRRVMNHLLGEDVVEKMHVVHSFPQDTENVEELIESSLYQGVFIPLSMTSQEMPDMKIFALRAAEKPVALKAQPEESEAPKSTEPAPPQASLADDGLKQTVDIVQEKDEKAIEEEAVETALIEEEEFEEAVHHAEEEGLEAKLPENSPDVSKEAGPSKVNLTTMISESGGGIAMPVEERVNIEEESEDTIAEGMFDEEDSEEEGSSDKDKGSSHK
jgi:triosephosphate isomerase